MAPPAPALSRSRLAADLRALGLREGSAVMVHTRMSALGWVIGGSGTVVSALLEALGPGGTLLAYASWEEHVYHASEWPEEHRSAYAAEPPVFDPATGEAARDHGRIPERVRTWPGARRSVHPEASVVAVGRLARELTEDHPQDDAYGPRSPFARLVAAGGDVLLLGAPLETLTLLHHAEAIAPIPGKRTVTFEIPVAGPGGIERRTYTDIDTSRGAYPYERLGLPADEFAVIATAALEAGVGTTGTVGAATCHLFPAAPLVDFATTWLRHHFTHPPRGV
jgi:aminoglycoside 3-N-acetyltransferase